MVTLFSRLMLTQIPGYVVVDSDKRFLLLFSFLKRMMKKKIIVFFSSCACVKYHSELLNYSMSSRSFFYYFQNSLSRTPETCPVVLWLTENGNADFNLSVDLPVLDLHGKQKQQKRTNTFFEFCNAKQGTLICTDVAARGLDVS